MTQKHHVRTVSIHTCTARCDVCGTGSQASAVETLLGQGWQLGDGSGVPGTGRDVPDLCPVCATVERERAHRRAEDEARARSIATLEAGEVPLVHGRIYADAETERARADGLNRCSTRCT